MSAPGTRAWCRWQDGTLILEIRVQPRARRDEVAGEHGGRLKIRLAAAPVDGRANDALVRFLAGLFGVPASSVELLAGRSGREKRVAIRTPRTLPPWMERPPGRTAPAPGPNDRRRAGPGRGPLSGP